MGELGDLLELVHGAHSQLSTLEVEYRDWICPRPSLGLSVERTQEGEPQIRWLGGGAFPRPRSARRRIWLCAPDRVRVEVVYGRELVRIGVRRGPRWLRWDRIDGLATGDLSDYEDEDGITAPALLFPPLIQPARLLSALSFEPAGKSRRAGREVLAARGRSRYSSASAETLEFEFDVEHGTILRRATFERGEPVSVTEAVAIRYGDPIELQMFELAPPDGKSVCLVQRVS